MLKCKTWHRQCDTIRSMDKIMLVLAVCLLLFASAARADTSTPVSKTEDVKKTADGAEDAKKQAEKDAEAKKSEERLKNVGGGFESAVLGAVGKSDSADKAAAKTIKMAAKAYVYFMDEKTVKADLKKVVAAMDQETINRKIAELRESFKGSGLEASNLMPRPNMKKSEVLGLLQGLNKDKICRVIGDCKDEYIITRLKEEKARQEK